MQQSEIGDENDFERATDLGESEESYYYEEETKPNASNSDGSDTEGFYMPTLIHKSKSSATKAAKQKKKKKKQ